MAPVTVAAVDLGASSGRVMLATVGADTVELEEVHRFPNAPVPVGDHLHTDILALWQGVLEGLRIAGARAGGLDAIGIDSWAVDHGLLDADGRLLGNPFHYRDARTDGVMARVFADVVPADQVYATTGIQNLPFNTAWQLVAGLGTAQQDMAEAVLLLPDLLAHWLTGRKVAEVTNASTTQLLDVTRREWSGDLITRLGLDRSWFPELIEPGTVIGPATTPDVEDVPVVAVGSHDTASAVVGVPATTDRFAYISCGTWSLVGVELDGPVLTDASHRANFTNELGVDGTVRYLRNVMGLWLLQESIGTWEAEGHAIHLPVLLAKAEAVQPFTAVIDPDDHAFLPPGDMPARIAEACRRTGQPVPSDPATTTRVILDSLALAYRRTVRQAVELSGRDVDVVHVVGGGSRNALLCQLTANACQLPVVAGPVEGAALGNALIQARALGAAPPTLSGMRHLLAATQPTTHYEPTGDPAIWDSAEARLST